MICCCLLKNLQSIAALLEVRMATRRKKTNPNPKSFSIDLKDSTIIYTRYADRGYYGDTSAPATFVVTELGEELKSDKKYYSNYKKKKLVAKI